MPTKLRHIITAAIAVSGVMLSGCSGTDGPEQSGPSADARKFSVAFTITAGSGGSRAPEIVGEETGTSAECRVILSQLQFMLFDSEGKFLQNLMPQITEGNDGTYTAVSTFTEPWITERLGSDAIKLHILALANGGSMGSNWAPAERGATAIADLFGSAQPTRLTATPDADALLTPGGATGIPMSGIRSFTINGAELAESTESNPLNLTPDEQSHILLLRALAKIEVIDHINYTGEYMPDKYGDNDNRIVSAYLAGHMDCGVQLPSLKPWTDAEVGFMTQQSTSPFLPEGAKYSAPPSIDTAPDSLNEADCLTFAYDAAATALRSDNAPVYSVYTYEFESSATSGQAPYIMIKTKGDDLEVFPLGQYKDGKPDPANTYLSALIRNHIYRYEIQQRTGHKLEMEWTVCNMDTITIDIPKFE